jgi:hypothetical protein
MKSDYKEYVAKQEASARFDRAKATVALIVCAVMAVVLLAWGYVKIPTALGLLAIFLAFGLVSGRIR